MLTAWGQPALQGAWWTLCCATAVLELSQVSQTQRLGEQGAAETLTENQEILQSKVQRTAVLAARQPNFLQSKLQHSDG